MCEICGRHPWDARCPDAPEPQGGFTCSRCNGEIVAGEEYFDSPEGHICKNCIEDMTIHEFMELIGEAFSTAEKEE